MAIHSEERLEFLGNRENGYSLEELLSSEAELLGKGNLGTSYKTFLPSGEVVVVKRLKTPFACGDWKLRIQQLGEISHPNLLPLRAYMFSQYEKLLIFDYIPNGSLSLLLHGNKGQKKTPLGWEARTKIAYGIACGVHHIHSQGSDIFHGNIRSSNVFLTDSYIARLSDFGIAQLFPPHAEVNLVSGYCAPEVKHPHDICHRSDVYSFGVLLLELLTGKAPLNALPNKEDTIDLPKRVRSMFQEKPIIDVFDRDLVKYEKTTGDQMVHMLQLAICCTFQIPTKRPSMAAVMDRIREICGF